MWLKQQSLVAAITAFSLFSSVHGLPTNGYTIATADDKPFHAKQNIIDDNGHGWDGSFKQLLDTEFHLAKGVGASPEWLRIMPLGASITRGLKSKSGNGYRKTLRERLEALDWKINMVGSLANGDMNDNQHEGHAGKRIEEVTKLMEKSKNAKPNVYLINVGTNNCLQNHNKMKGAIKDMEALLDKSWKQSEKATIVLSTLVPSNVNEKNPKTKSWKGTAKRVEDFNKEIRDLVKRLRDDHKSIVLAEMHDNQNFIRKDDLIDGIHPTDDGYRKMAAVWEAAILEAREAGMLKGPEDNGQSDEKWSLKTKRFFGLW